MADKTKSNTNNSKRKSNTNNSKSKKKEKSKSLKTLEYVGHRSVGLLEAVFIILIGVILIRVLYDGVGASGVSFESLLDVLSGAPTVSTTVKDFFHTSGLDSAYSGIEFLDNFVNMFFKSIQIVIWLASCIVDLMIFISYFLYWVFV